MKINYVNDVTKLIYNVRQTELLNRGIKVYRNSLIELRRISINKLMPCQTYVLETQLIRINEINHELTKQCGINIANLEGYLELDNKTTFTPPIVELDDEGEILINDGMHRVFWCLENDIKYINCVYIENPSHPYYAYTLADWECVEVFQNTIPDNFVKKYHRIKDYKSLYRDFNTAFKYHVGKPRGRGKKC